MFDLSLRLATLKPKSSFIDTDVLIIGGGPAAFGAALYSARYKLKTVVVAESIGGQLNLTNVIENYLGFARIEASELTAKFKQHVEEYGVELVNDKVVEVRKDGNEFEAKTKMNRTIRAKALIIAIGLKRRKLNVPGEQEFASKGVSYCSICDAAFFKDADAVAVIGGGDSAAEGALILSEYAKKVYLIHRRDTFRAQPILIDAVKSRKNIEIVYNTVVKEIRGDKKVNAILTKNVITGEEKLINVQGVFVEIGFEPDTMLPKMLGVETDDYGFIKVKDYMRTNVDGVFAAGDCTDLWKAFRQVITAAAQGAVAAHAAYMYISERKLK